MATQRRVPRRRRSRPTGPNGALVTVAIVLGGLAVGALGRIGFSSIRPAAQPTPTPTPVRSSAVPRIAPTSRADVLGLKPHPAASPTPRRIRIVLPTPAPPTFAPGSPTPSPTSSPQATPSPTAPATRSPEPTASPTIRPTASPTARPKATSSGGPRGARSSPIPAAKPKPISDGQTSAGSSRAARTARAYLQALMRGDEVHAYSLLGGSAGEKGLSLSEEAFVTRDARIGRISTQPSGAASTVQAEVATATGLYVVTFEIEARGGKSIITRHEYIKP